MVHPPSNMNNPREWPSRGQAEGKDSEPNCGGENFDKDRRCLILDQHFDNSGFHKENGCGGSRSGPPWERGRRYNIATVPMERLMLGLCWKNPRSGEVARVTRIDDSRVSFMYVTRMSWVSMEWTMTKRGFVKTYCIESPLWKSYLSSALLLLLLSCALSAAWILKDELVVAVRDIIKWSLYYSCILNQKLIFFLCLVVFRKVIQDDLQVALHVKI